MSACIAVLAMIISLNLQVNDTIVAQADASDLSIEVSCGAPPVAADSPASSCKDIQKGQSVWVLVEIKNNTGGLISNIKTTHTFPSDGLEMIPNTYAVDNIISGNNKTTPFDETVNIGPGGTKSMSYTLTATEEVDSRATQSAKVVATWGDPNGNNKIEDSAFFSSVEGCDDTTPNSVDCSEPPPIGSKPPPDKLDSDGDGTVDASDPAPNSPCLPRPVQDNGNLWPGSPWCPMVAIFDIKVPENIGTLRHEMEVVPNPYNPAHAATIGGFNYNYFNKKFTVSLDTKDPEGPITEQGFDINIADPGTDYRDLNGTVINIDPNLTGREKYFYPINIEIIDDDVYEGDEHFMIWFSGVTNLDMMIEARESGETGAYGIITIIDNEEKPPEPPPNPTPTTQTTPTPDPISGTPKPNPQATLPENDQRAQNALDDIIYGTNCDSLGQTRSGAAGDCQPDDSDCIRELNSGNITNLFWPGSNTPIIPKSCATATFTNTDGVDQNIQAGLPVEFIPNVASRAYGFMASIAAYLFVVLFSIWGVQWMIGGLQYKSEDDLFNIKKNMRNSALALIITLTVSVLVIELLPVFGVSDDILGFKIRG